MFLQVRWHVPLLAAMQNVGQVALILDPTAELSQGPGTGFGNRVCRGVEQFRSV